MRDAAFKIASILASLCVGCVLGAIPGLAQLTPQQAAGKQVYLQGTSPSARQLEAILGDGSTRVPARLMLCASCHGADGRGRPEGGVVPSNITWDVLTRPFRSDGPEPRQRPAYNLSSLRRAITAAVDPAGNHLSVAMPRYRVSPRDLNNLVEYLKVLGNEPEPGVTATAIRIGVIVSQNAAADDSATAVLQAYFDELNRQRGIYNRKIELLTIKTAGSMSDTLRQAGELVEEKKVFALLLPFAPVSELGIAGSLKQLKVPTVVSFAPDADVDWSEQSSVFFVLSGLFQQTGILARFARDHHESREPPPAIVYPESMQALADSIAEQCRSIALGDAVPLKYVTFDASAIAASLSRQNIRTLFFLGNGGELLKLSDAAGKLNWEPAVLQPGPLAGQALFDISEPFAERVFLSFPTLPSDLEPEAMQEFQMLLRHHNLTPLHPAASLAALASAKVLTEGLRQAGRRLDRARLVDVLTRLHDFNTGLTPLVSYGPGRRIGALGGYVVKWDGKNKTFTPVNPWLTP
jgi:ABC-type branched-subunit amino acid transport system substrate-binding protein